MKLLKTILRLLTFRLTREEILQWNYKHFLVGLIGTWVVGMGRYWDDSGAKLLQHLGMGSVVYIFALALFIWLIVLPLKVKNWNYFVVVTFIGLTSFPAIFYAIPVERFVSLPTANTLNALFLGIVALWRLALLYYFLRVFTRLNYSSIITVTLMPICVIITSLTVLNLHRVVFNIMSGIRDASPHDSSYLVLLFLTWISALAVVPLLIAYFIIIFQKRKQEKDKV